MIMDNRKYILLIIVILAGFLLLYEPPAEYEPVHMEPIEIDVPKTVHVESLGVFTVTAYCPCPDCCDKWADGLTYSGVKATEGRTVAVDPNVIPLGTEIEIDGKTYIAEDIGGGIKGKRIDLYFDSHDDAKAFGRKELEIKKEVFNENISSLRGEPGGYKRITSART